MPGSVNALPVEASLLPLVAVGREKKRPLAPFVGGRDELASPGTCADRCEGDRFATLLREDKA